MRLLFIMLVGLFIALPQVGRAAAISNLSPDPQTISYKIWGGERVVIIPPGETWRIPGRVNVSYHGRWVEIHPTQEFAIWKDGVFGPQRYRRRHSAF